MAARPSSLSRLEVRLGPKYSFIRTTITVFDALNKVKSTLHRLPQKHVRVSKPLLSLKSES